MTMATLNIYSAQAWHDPVLIVGTKEGIEALRNACQEALDSGWGGSSNVFSGDGEGYDLLVEIVSEDVMPLLPSHYCDDIAADHREQAAAGLLEVLRVAYQRHIGKRVTK